MIRWRHAWVRAGDALRCIREARRGHGAGLADTVVRFVELYGVRRYSIAEIEAQDLLDPAITRAELDRRQSKEAQLEMQMRLNPRAHWRLTEDKAVFERHCRDHGLAVPRSFGTFEFARQRPGERPAKRAEALRVLARASTEELIVKPVDGVYGRGVYRLAASDGAFLGHDGRRRTPEAVYAWIEDTCDFERFLVQERVRPHPELAHLSGTDSLQTVRMVTYVAANGSVSIGNCQLRVIVGDSPVDNYGDGRTGNLLCDIPRASGVVARGCGAAAGGRRFVAFARHPRTGIAFAGFRVPAWDAACRLVRDAATAFLPLRTVGWDVAITDGEPLLIEGNVTWDPAYEGLVGSEIPGIIRRDGLREAPAVPPRRLRAGEPEGPPRGRIRPEAPQRGGWSGERP